MIFVNRGTDDSVEMGVEPKPLSPDLGRASVGSSIFFLRLILWRCFFMNKNKTQDLVLIAMYVAIFAVLEYLSRTFNLLKMPQGGSVSLSIIPLMMASYHLGFKKSLIVAALSFVVRFMIKAPTIVHWFQFLADYIFAFGAYSIAGLFKDRKVGEVTLPMGVLHANFLRFMFHNIAGWVFFAEYYPGNVFKGVMVYNATYMVPTLIYSFILMMFIKPRLEPRFK